MGKNKGGRKGVRIHLQQNAFPWGGSRTELAEGYNEEKKVKTFQIKIGETISLEGTTGGKR